MVEDAVAERNLNCWNDTSILGWNNLDYLWLLEFAERRSTNGWGQEIQLFSAAPKVIDVHWCIQQAKVLSWNHPAMGNKRNFSFLMGAQWLQEWDFSVPCFVWVVLDQGQGPVLGVSPAAPLHPLPASCFCYPSFLFWEETRERIPAFQLILSKPPGGMALAYFPLRCWSILSPSLSPIPIFFCS